MSDEPNYQQPRSNSNATPASNQNLIVGLIMGAAILLLLFLVFNANQNNLGSTNEAAEVAALQKRIEDLKLAKELSGNQQNFGAGTNTYGVDPLKLAEEISVEANTLAGMIGNFAKTIQEKEALLQTARDREAFLNSRVQDLQRKNLELNELASEALTLRKEIESLRTLYNNAQRQIEELRKRPDASTLEELRRQNDELRARLAALTDLESENAKLRAENQRLRTLADRSTLFVESADALPATAQRLFRELQRLDDRSPAQLESEYQRIERILNARPLRSINFATGASQLTNEKISIIQNDLAGTHPEAFLLVVGYASRIGNSEANRKLSSDRATSVASRVNLDKRSTQNVRGVFLSETNRFSKEQATLNQICEVWEIRP